MRFLMALWRSPTLAAALLLAGLAILFNGSQSNSTVYKWSTTAATNASSDSTINWAEGMAPSGVNDSARAMMAAVAKWRDDMNGAASTSGSSTAYTLSTNQGFASLSVMSGQHICFRPHTTNRATVTLNVDTLGAKALRSAPGVDLPAGVLIQEAPYCATYNNSGSEWVLVGMSGIAWQIPIGGIIDFGGLATPTSNFVIPRGQTISRTTYTTLFALFGTTYGSGDGTTTFNVPDLGGRVVAGLESSPLRLTSGGSGCAGNTLGATCGAETITLATGNLPAHSHSFSGSVSNDGSHSHNISGYLNTGAGSSTGPVMTNTGTNGQSSVTSTEGSHNHSGTFSGTTGSTGSGNAVNKTQPTIVLNKLLRVL
jgi:microcystin-dependent protein